MSAYVALLYSIVLAPGRRVVMSDLRAMAEEAGFANPRTLLASGNLVFEADEPDPRALEARLEPAFAARFGRRIDVIVRAGADWPRLLAGNPFQDAAAQRPSRLAVRVMRTPAAPELLAALEPYRAEGERIALVDGDLWVDFPHGQGSSRLAGAITPRRAGIGTFRSWNTVCRLQALVQPERCAARA